jgi:hypothetical protein
MPSLPSRQVLLLGLRLLLLSCCCCPPWTCADVSSVDVFTHGEHPLCTCLRIPSVVATDTHLYAFAECRSWRGDGCDPMSPSSSSSSSSSLSRRQQRVSGADRAAAGGSSTHIAMKSSADGGEHWSEIVILTEGCQPTAVYDVSRDMLLFIFKNNTHQDARLMTLAGHSSNFTAPRLVIDPATQERDHRPLFPGPGNAIVLSPTHPTHPGRLLIPVWLGPDGPATSASLFYSDDGGDSFTQTSTSWPRDGNDESTIAELASGEVLYVTRSNSAPCRARHHGGITRTATSRCLELARSTDGGSSFAQVGSGTVNDELAGVPAAVSLLAVAEPSHAGAMHNYFRTNWKPCTQSEGGWATNIERQSTFVISTPPPQPQQLPPPLPLPGRQSWANVSIAATPTSTIYLEGPDSVACAGNPDYSSVRCNAQFHGALYTSTCFDLLPLSPAAAAPIKYGDSVVLRDPAKYGGRYLNPASGSFDLDSRAAAGWTLVDAAAPNSTAVFVGAAFALRPGAHPPPYTPPPPPRSPNRPNRTLYLSHPENLAMTGRTNGTVRASVDGRGVHWPWTFQATLDTHPHAPSVYARQAFGYSCLTAMPAGPDSGSPFDSSKYLGLLWESSTNDCAATDASCVVKFSVVPMIPRDEPRASTAWSHRANGSALLARLKLDDEAQPSQEGEPSRHTAAAAAAAAVAVGTDEHLLLW